MTLLFFFFSSNLWSIYASMLFYVSRDHHHFSYGKGSSKLQIFTLPHTDPARLFCRKSLRCATNKSTKNLGCASAILSILACMKDPLNQETECLFLFCQVERIQEKTNQSESLCLVDKSSTMVKNFFFKFLVEISMPLSAPNCQIDSAFKLLSLELRWSMTQTSIWFSQEHFHTDYFCSIY